jgi:hypothetical protein
MINSNVTLSKLNELAEMFDEGNLEYSTRTLDGDDCVVNNSIVVELLLKKHSVPHTDKTITIRFDADYIDWQDLDRLHTDILIAILQKDLITDNFIITLS